MSTLRHSRLRIAYAALLGVALALGTLAMMPILAQSSNADPVEGYANRSPTFLQMANQAGPGQFVVDLTYDAIWGYVAPGDTITVAQGSGNYGAAQADALGFFWTPLWQSSGRPADITGTDTLQVHVNGSLSATITVSGVTGLVDVLNDRVVGTINGVAASTPVTVTLGTDPGAPSASATTDASGRFTATFTTVDLNPGHNAVVEYRHGPHTLRALLAPSQVFGVSLGWNSVGGYAQPGQAVTATVYAGSGPAVKTVMTGQANKPQGYYDLKPSDTTVINGGDVVEVNLEGGVIISTTVVTLTMDTNPTTDLVMGTAPAGERLWANLSQWADDKNLYYQVTTTADATGVYTANFSGVADVQVYDWIGVAVADSKGNETNLWSGAPMISVDESDNSLWARVNGPNLTVTATLDTGSGTFTQTGTSGLQHYINLGRFPGSPDIQPGHQITLETVSWLGAMSVANLSASLDTAGNRLLGNAPTGRAQAEIHHTWSNRYPAGLGRMIRQITVTSPFTLTYANFDVRDSDGVWLASHDSAGFVTGRWIDSRVFQVNAPYGVWSPQLSPSDVLTATLYASDGVTVKRQTSQDTDADSTSYWMEMQGQIAVGDWVTVTDGAGWTASLQVPTLTVQANDVTDLIWGQGPKSLLLVQRNWDWQSAHFVPCDDYKLDAAYFGLDLLPGDRIETTYLALNGNRIVREIQLPAPALRLRDKSAQGNPGEGGNLVFRIQYQNAGDAVAENTVITDTLLGGMVYITDTSPFTHTGSGSGPIVWHLGNLAPSTSESYFDVFVQITAAQGNNITNTAQIATRNPYDQGEPGEKERTWSGQVQVNDTHLGVDKWAWTGDPTPGYDTVFAVNVCNNGSTGSSQVTLADTTHPSMTLKYWWGQTPGWTQVVSSSHQLVISRPSLSGGQCEEVYVRAQLSASAWPDMPISNTAVITASNDLEDNDNEITWEGGVGNPHTNLNINKNWNRGQLVPGGQLRYNINYNNNGNVPVVATIHITDTLPVSTTFRESLEFGGGPQVVPVFTGTDYVVWQVNGLDNGYSGGFEVVLDVNDNAPPGIVLTNTVEIRSHPDEDSYTDNTSTVTETLHAPGPNLRVTTAREWQMDGSQLRYDIQFENVGSEIVYNVWLTDVLPADTSIAWRNMQFDPNRIISSTQTGTRLCWEFSELNPGDSGWLSFAVNLDDPNARPRWYTNTVEITTSPSDTNPTDNTAIDVAVKGEVDRAEIWMNTTGDSNMWGQAVPGTVTITTAYTQVTAFADPACGGCWPNGGPNPDVGPVQPGDTLTVTAGAGLLPVIIHVPNPFTAYASSITDTVWGQIGGWINQTLEVHGSWPSGYKEVTTNASGYYTATYADVPRGAQGYVRFITLVTYADVIFHHSFQSADMILTVNYTHDWVETNYEAGHTVWLTVTDNAGTVKATMVDTTTIVPWWGGQTGFSTNMGTWAPSQPDIVPDDWVYGAIDGIYTSSARVGTITGMVDTARDSVSGTVSAPWFSQTLNAQCWIDGVNNSNRDFTVAPNGGAYSCDFASIWDLLPGQTVSVQYQEPDGDWVRGVFHEPAPALSIDKWADGNPGEGSNFIFHVSYSNNGGAPAENTVITDTLVSGMSYLTDTSSFSHSGSGAGPIIWNLDTLPANSSGQFDVYVQITAAQSNTITNTVEIATSNPYDQGQPGDKQRTWTGHVEANGTRLDVGKGAWTGDPAPGQDVVFDANVCNNGGPDTTASSRLYLTDTLNLSMTLRYWWGQTPGWTPVISNSSQLVVYKESLSNGQCDRVFLRVHLDASLTPGTPISNTVVISASNDLTLSDNESTWWGNVGNPRTNLSLSKDWNWGQLVPGGEIRYNLNYRSDGNLPVTSTIRITDTLPVSTTFREALEFGDGPPVAPVFTGTNYVVWEMNGLDNGYSDGFEIVLRVDSNAISGTVLNNCAATSANVFEDNPYDNSTCVTEAVRAAGPNLRATKFAYWQGTGGIQYQVRIENIGTATVNAVTITDTFPVSMTLNNWNINVPGGWGPWSSGQSGNQLTVTLNRLEPGWATWLNMWLSVPGVPNGTFFTNTVTVTTPPDDVNPADNSAVNVMGTGPDLSIEKWLTGGTPKPGQWLTFTLHLRNQAQSWDTMGTVWITDTLPSGLEFVNAKQRLCGSTYFCDQGPDYNDGTTLSWNIGGMCPGCWNDILVTTRVTTTAQGGDVLTNTAKIASDSAGDTEPFMANNTSALPVTVINPKFQLSKSYASSLVAGMPITYTIVVTNVGNETATGIVVTDALPAAVGGGVATWSGLSIPASNATQVMTNASLTCSAGQSFINQWYRVATSDQGATSGFGPALALTTLSPTLSVAFTYGPSPIVVNSTIRFTGTSSTNGRPLSYAWGFGDGTGGNGLTTSHVYTRDGTFTVVFTGTDTCGFNKVQTTTVTVQPVCTPVTGLNFTYLPIPAIVNTATTFTATYTTGDPAPTFAWRVDGGTPMNGQSMVYTFTTTGTHTVAVTATNTCGSIPYNRSIVVDPRRVYLPIVIR